VAFGSRPADRRFGDFSRGIATSALRKSRKLQQLKLLSNPLVNSRSINSSSKRVALKNWISHVTRQGPLSVCVQR
jgi:hypothetical protein